MASSSTSACPSCTGVTGTTVDASSSTARSCSSDQSSTWPTTATTERCDSSYLAKVQGSRTVPIGDAILEFNDTSMGIETCEELFTSNAPHIQQALAGAEIFSNASGSHHNLRKLNKRLSLIRQACEEGGGVYIYANQQGCDGDRLYYDGCASIFLNGEIIAQGSQFSVQDVECVTAVVDLDEVTSTRFAPSRGQQVNQTPEPAYPRIYVDYDFMDATDKMLMPSPPMPPRIHLPEEEIALGPACWL
jgi:NAD+ synthase (glutamine-hydrolysing)